MRWFDSERKTLTEVATPAISSSASPPEGDGHRQTGVRRGSSLAPSVRDALGPLSRYAEPGVTDLLVTPDGQLWLDSGDGLRGAAGWHPLGEQAVIALAYALIESGGRHLDHASPCVDVRLEGGVRVHAAIPPVSIGGTALSIRVPAAGGWSIDDLVDAAMITNAQRDLLALHVSGRSNLLITGPAGTGKTTLLAALMAEVPKHERIITIEDVAELQIHHPHVVSLEARQANIEGAGAIEPQRLVREALRMRPDRIVLGECRGAELRDMLMALGTGHDGGAGTLHARSLDDVPARLEALGALAGMSTASLGRLAASSLDLVVQLERRDGVRRVAGMGALELKGDVLSVAPLPGP